MVKLEDIRITPQVQRQIDTGLSPISVIVSPNAEYSIDDLHTCVTELPDLDPESVERSEHYVFATLSPAQIQQLAERDEVRKIWLDHPVTPFTHTSAQTVGAPHAWQEAGVRGEGVIWAVIDSGIDDGHEALQDTVIQNIDFTGEGNTGNHGTHIASIIAGRSATFGGIAPGAKLFNLKVVGSKGGRVSWTIQAMEAVRKINSQAGEMVVHGANMSIGQLPGEEAFKAFTLGTFQPGGSPVCEEANRLVESGVVVCVSSGDYGAQEFEVVGKKGATKFPTIVTMTIADPGNAELPITVGSTHKQDPEKYGISIFSSRGPTVDGRQKPDLVAPGEKILGALPGDKYERLSGTSQATAHVSGVAALLLSAFPSLIGKPMEVKDILIKSCRDIHRARNFQGAGVVDVKAALQEAAQRQGQAPN